MIKLISSNNPKFRTVEFHKGYNIILADRKDSNDKEDKKRTRNGAGKTTLIEIIHFCLGADVKDKSIFKSEHLKGWSFILTIEIYNQDYKLERYTDNTNKIYIYGNLNKLNWNLKLDKTGNYYITPKNLNKELLGYFFGIDNDENSIKYCPTFRELISYIIRRTTDGYRDAFEYYPRQKAYSRQACNTYFLGLNMEYASDFQELKDKIKAIDDFKKAAKSGVIGNFSLNIGELNTEVITRQRDLEKLKLQIDTFKVHPQYTDITKEANEITYDIHQFSNNLAIRKQLLDRYESSIAEEEIETPIINLEKIYLEAGIIFGNNLKKNLTDVVNFHKTIIKNRKEYLSTEIQNIRNEIRNIESNIENLSNKRSEIMQTLETHGALEEYTHLQERYAILKQLYEDAKRRLESAEYIEDSKSKIKIENQELLLKSRQDYAERHEARERAISIFKLNTEFLYPNAGTLTIDLKETGYTFDIEIKSSKSQGVNYMKVFCYDMLIAELGSKRKYFPDFLIHDSTIFDGVDERQIALALMLSKNKSEENDFQYICFMNSDKIPYEEFDIGFKEYFMENIILRLDDETNDGGLLGIRF